METIGIHQNNGSSEEIGTFKECAKTISPPLIDSDILELMVATHETTQQSPRLHTPNLGMRLPLIEAPSGHVVHSLMNNAKQMTSHRNVFQSTHTRYVIGDSETQMLPKFVGKSGRSNC